MTTYMGLDIATTTGIALWQPEINKAYVSQIKCDPVYLMMHILATEVHVGEDCIFVLEHLASIRNAKTTRILAQRYGYVKYTLESWSKRYEECHTSTVRSYLKLKTKTEVKEFFQDYSSKKLTDDHTDALAVAIYQAHVDGHPFEPERLRIERV